MTPEQKAAFINSKVACLNAELQGMIIANAEARGTGNPKPYGEPDFLQLADKYELGQNAVLKFFNASPAA